jgi:hypothetical protein
MYDSSDGVPEHAASPSPPFSLTPVHRCCTQVHRFSPHSPVNSAYLCETDVSKYVWQEWWCFWGRNFPVSPLLTHTCTQVHRFSEHSPTDSSYLCETDVSKYVWQERWCFWARSFPTVPLLAHACTQVHRFSPHSPEDSAYLWETDVSMYVWQQEWRNPVYARRIDSSALVFKSFITPILIYKFCL